ncbi:MAG: hypothetical protein KDE31_01115, partial [Caldilineaceae bacterium]|nr:hypothetical protein [Caldilineaceae bacterium]
VDARPDAMGMTTSVLLMKDDCPRLPAKTELGFDPLNRVLELRDGDRGIQRRVERDGEEILAALRALGDRLAFGECTGQIGGDETVGRGIVRVSWKGGA